MTTEAREINLIYKSIKDFNSKDTIYITKLVNGYSHTYLCKFVRYDRGVVTGEIISWGPDWCAHARDKGQEIKARLGKCYLWGANKKISWSHQCYWFKKGNRVTIRRHKYNAVPTLRDGYRFDSKKEAARYDRNKILLANGELIMQLRQVPFHLPGGVIYRLDFQEWYDNGDVLFIDVKGVDTSASKLKRKQVEALYPVKIQLV